MIDPSDYKIFPHSSRPPFPPPPSPPFSHKFHSIRPPFFRKSARFLVLADQKDTGKASNPITMSAIRTIQREPVNRSKEQHREYATSETIEKHALNMPPSSLPKLIYECRCGQRFALRLLLLTFLICLIAYPPEREVTKDSLVRILYGTYPFRKIIFKSFTLNREYRRLFRNFVSKLTLLYRIYIYNGENVWLFLFIQSSFLPSCFYSTINDFAD